MGIAPNASWLPGSTSARGVVKEAANWVLVIVILMNLLITAHSEQCKQRFKDNLVFGSVKSTQLRSNYCDLWVLSDDLVTAGDSCPPDANGQLYLLFEFWRSDDDELQNSYFLVARGAQPSVRITDSKFEFVPPLADDPQSGQNSTLVDEAAVNYWRPYHRVVVPVNANVSDGMNTRNWYVTVANLETNPLGWYVIDVSCVAEPAPCPRPSLSDPTECSGRGVCVDPPAGVVRPGINRNCECQGDWGDYGCQTPAPTVSTGALLSQVLDPQSWAYWQLSVPVPTYNIIKSNIKPTLLVELSRSVVGAGGQGFGAGGGYGGNPILVVMPKGVNDSNRVPWFTDLKQYGDLRSYLLEQNFHYVLLRDMPATLQRSGRGGNTAEFYVAVYNDMRSSMTRPLLNQQANITLRFRWQQGGSAMGGSSSQPLCPGDCFGAGTCYDPGDTSVKRPDPIIPAMPGQATPDFQCACNSGYGGTMCEGSLRNVSVSTSGDGGRGTLAPGQWSFLIMTLDSRRFDFNNDDLAIDWAVRDATTSPPIDYTNAYLTVDMQNFPRTSQLDSMDPFKRGYLVFYSTLVKTTNPPQPLQIKGSDLRPGYTYVLGVYNSDYVRQVAFEYTISVYVPQSVRTWLRPYMSVVLGVTASIILCLLMSLCRRVLQRYGWGPFRPRTDGLGGQAAVSRVQVAHLQQRPQGVPADIVDSFYSYEYSASKAQKEQLARSGRDMASAQSQAQAQGPGERSRPGTATRSPGSGRLAAPGDVVELTPVTSAPRPTAAGGSATAAGGSAAASPAPEQVASTSVAVMAAAAAADPLQSPAVLAGGSPVSGVGGGDDDDEPQCTVCLCEYEEGELITRLPCRHEFHGTCINKWLQTHYTCPICRVSLLPEQPESEPEAARQLPRHQSAAELLAPTGGGPIGAGTEGTAGSSATAPGRPLSGGGGGPVSPTAQSPPPPAGLFSRLLLGSRRHALSRNATATGSDTGNGTGYGNQLGQPTQQQQPRPGQPQPSAPWTGGVAEAVAPAEPVPAQLVADAASRGAGGGEREVPYGAVAVVSAAPPAGGASQLLARGPTATLMDPSPPGTSGGGGGMGDPLERSPTSPNRLAAGRLAASSSRPVPLGDDRGAPAAGSPSGWITPVRHTAMLPQQMDMEGAEPPGLSQAGRSSAPSAIAAPAAQPAGRS